MNKITLILAYKSMLYALRNEGLEVPEKYLEFENELLNNYDFDIVDVLDNLENIYQAINNK